MGLPGLNGFVGEFTILLGSMDGAAYGPTPWIYTAFYNGWRYFGGCLPVVDVPGVSSWGR